MAGPRFLVDTDHAALYWLLRKKDPERQMARCIAFLQEYDLCLEHQPGKKHSNADSLSCCMEGCSETDDLVREPGAKLPWQSSRTYAQCVLGQAGCDQEEMQEEQKLALDEFFGDQLVGPEAQAPRLKRREGKTALSRGAPHVREPPCSSIIQKYCHQEYGSHNHERIS